jgi:glycerol kinase
MAGDQQAAMFGEMGFERGAVKITFGTSGMLDVNVGDFPVFSTRGAYPLVLWSLGGQRMYCLEGTVITVGAAVQWLREGLGILTSVEDSAALASQAADSGGVWFVPAFQGLGTPHMLPEARATFGGLSRASTKAQVVRSVLEGIAFRTREVFDTLIEDAGVERPQTLRVDGGAASNNVLLQLVADATGIAVERPACVQASAVGAAYLAGIAAGVWDNADVLRRTWRSGGVFEPRVSADERDSRFASWRRAVEAVGALSST